MLYNLEAGRDDAQIRQMEDLERRGVCVFCSKHFAAEHREPVYRDGDFWYLTGNDYPYESTTLHLLLVAKAHVASLSELPSEALAEFGQFLALVERDWKLTHCGIGMRSGDFRYNGSTIEHLHAHIIVVDPNPATKVRFAMSRAPK